MQEPPMEERESYIVSDKIAQKLTNDQLRAVVRAYWDTRSEMHTQKGVVKRLTDKLSDESHALAKLARDERALSDLLDILDPAWQVD